MKHKMAVPIVTSPIDLQSWNHSFAKIGRIVWVSALPLPDEQPTALYFFGLPIHEQLQDCKGMLPIGTPCKPMLPVLATGERVGHPLSGANAANLCFQPCKPMGEVTCPPVQS